MFLPNFLLERLKLPRGDAIVRRGGRGGGGNFLLQPLEVEEAHLVLRCSPDTVRSVPVSNNNNNNNKLRTDIKSP
eukprot:531174-Prorocentrum_minimum.AAC.1